MLGVFHGFCRDESEKEDDYDNDHFDTAVQVPEEAISGPVAENDSAKENNNDNRANAVNARRCPCGSRRFWLLGMSVLILLVVLCIIIIVLVVHDGGNGTPKASSVVGDGNPPTVVETISPSMVPTKQMTSPNERPTMIGTDSNSPTTSGLRASMAPSTNRLTFSPGHTPYPSNGPTTIPLSVVPSDGRTELPEGDLSGSPVGTPSVMPTSQKFAHLLDQIETMFRFTVPATDMDSPSYKAVEWLATKDQVLATMTESSFLYKRRLAQRYVLALLYYSTSGLDSWKDQCRFLDGNLDECQWKCQQTIGWTSEDQGLLSSKRITNQGIYCYDLDGYEHEIEHIFLVNNGLAGSLPTELIQLIALRTLWVFNNDLTGSIPEALVENYFLEEARLESNGLTGSALPWSRMTHISQMRDWRASDNGLSGALSKDWQKASRLKILDLSWNSLTWNVTGALFSLPNLRRLLLAGNDLTGFLPDSMGTQVQVVQLENNRLSGPLPSNLVESKDLSVLILSDNDFSGSVPTSWAELSNLKVLDISGNPLLHGSLEMLCLTLQKAWQTVYATCVDLSCSCCQCV